MKQLSLIILLLAALFVCNFYNPQPLAEAESSTRLYVTPVSKSKSLPAEDPPLPSQAEIAQLISRTESDGYHVHADDQALHASNGRQGISAQWSLDDGQLRVESLNPNEAWHFAMKSPGAIADSEIQDNKLTLQRAAMDEWFINDARGIEHGFDVAEPPARSGDDGFSVSMEINTSLIPELLPTERSITFRNPDGEATLFYHGLLVFDATGRSLPASMDIAKTDSRWHLAIHVDDRDAHYPLVIDPVISTQTASLISSTRSASEQFGRALSMSGNLLAVGIPGAEGLNPGEINIGAVDLYRFMETTKHWAHQKRLFPGTPLGECKFGESLELRGENLIVGAPDDDFERGAAYVFRRDEGGFNNWGQVVKLVAPDGDISANFGSDVAIDGGIAAIGADRKTGPGMELFAGALYASFRNPSGLWSVPDQVTGYLPGANDRYGWDVAVDGNRIACSSYRGQTEATPLDAGIVVMHEFILGENGAPISQSTELIVDNNPSENARFGDSLDFEGDTLVVGSPGTTTIDGDGAGTVEIFREDPMFGWNWVTELRAANGQAHALFGDSVSFSGTTLLVGSPFYDHSAAQLDTGASYLFEKKAGPGNQWGFVEFFPSVLVQDSTYSASSVAISGDAFAVGAPYENHAIDGSSTGSVSTYERRSSEWHAVRLPRVNSSNQDQRGYSVAIDRGQSAVGWPHYSASFPDAGLVTVSAGNKSGEESWGLENAVGSPLAQEGEHFGHSVALAGNWLLVGAPGHDKVGAENAGQAYLFRKVQGVGWVHFKVLHIPGLPAGAEFGAAVALSSRWAFVGAPGSNHAYIFDRNEGGTDSWDISTILDESFQGGRFGSAVTVDNNYAAFSAPERDGIAPPGEIPATVQGAGQVIIYKTARVGDEVVWEEVKVLPDAAPDGSFGSLNAGLGSSLALDNGVLLAGSPGYQNDVGRVKAYGLNRGGPGNWGELQSLDSPSATSGDRFGSAVGIGSRWFFVGSPGQEQGGLETGLVHVYDRNKVADLASQAATSTIFHPYSGKGDRFGAALGISDNELIVGAPEMSSLSGTSGVGNYAIFHRQSSGWSYLGSPQGAIAGVGDQLGFSIAMDGDFLVAGAPFDEVDGSAAAGSVHLYRRNPAASTGWTYLKRLFAGDVQIGANFGYSVDIQGDTIVVGAPGHLNRGGAFVFDRNTGGSDVWGQEKYLTSIAIGNGDEFGFSVAIDQDLIVVGAPQDNQGGVTDTGEVYVFGRHAAIGSKWGFIERFHEETPKAFNYFGSAVDINDGRILIGVPLADKPGQDASGLAYLYDRVAPVTTWSLVETLDSLTTANDRVGGAVAIDGNSCVLGGIGDDQFAMASGAAWVYLDVSGDGAWTFDEKVTAGQYEDSTLQLSVNFGKSVAIKGDQMVVGAPGFDDGFINTGAAYVFERNQSGFQKWGLVRKLGGHAAGNSAKMGSAVAMIDDFFAAGAPEAEQGMQTDAGYVLFFGDVSSMNEEWARSHFGDVSVDNESLKDTVWGPTADPDGDGHSNALEAYMASDPQVRESTESLMQIAKETNGDFVFRYRIGKDVHGAVGRVKWSRDLIEWRGGEVGPEEFETATRVAEDHPGHFIMEARISADQLIDEPRLWMRLEVHVP